MEIFTFWGRQVSQSSKHTVLSCTNGGYQSIGWSERNGHCSVDRNRWEKQQQKEEQAQIRHQAYISQNMTGVQWYQAHKTHGMVTACLSNACRHSCLEKCWCSRLRAYWWFNLRNNLKWQSHFWTHKVLIFFLKQRSHCTGRKIEGMLEGFTAMHINERLLLTNHPRMKHIPSGSTKDPWDTLIVIDREENNHNFEADESFCSCSIIYAFATDWDYQRKTNLCQRYGSQAKGSQQSTVCQLSDFIFAYNYWFFFKIGGFNTSWQN